ncbi:MAG: glycoside hydrolase family 13 protein [Candidatus Eremiobacterota bacterium]
MNRLLPALLACLLLLAAGPDPAPHWASRVVWYQIFPERFRNGDPSNDPRLEDMRGSWPHDLSPPWQVHPWTSDWYELQPYEKASGKDIWFNLQRRRYGGDLQGILDRLDYLQELGVNALYLNPIFAAPSQHKYDAVLYHHVDPNFGPDPEGDRRLIASESLTDPSTWRWTTADRLALELVRECHRRGMRVIFDGVFNHIGMSSPFFRDVVERRQESPYRDWFTIKSWDPLDYEGWFGVRELPEWREDERGLVAGPREYVFAVTRRWMAPGDGWEGIDGWRLDVAFCVKHAFWKDWSRLVLSLNAEAYMTAEVIDTVEANRPFLQGDEFSAVMNYNFAFTASEFFVETRNPLTASQFDQRLRALREAYPLQVAYLMQNLMDSHDTARLTSNIVNRDLVTYRDWQRYCEVSKAKNPGWNPRGPNPGDRQLQKLVAIFQMTYVGAPMIYYGGETCLWGANDPDCRKPMIWADLTYSPERCNPDGSLRAPADPVAFDRDMFEHYRKLIAIRLANEPLMTGDFQTLLTDDARGLYGFARGGRVLVALNRSEVSQECRLSARPGASYRDLLNGGGSLRADPDGSLSVRLSPRWGAILSPID